MRDIDLSRFDDLYEAAASKGQRRGDPVPDGEYEAIIDSVELTRFPNTMTPKLLWRLRITDSDFVGHTVEMTRGITERSLAWIKEDLAKCGLVLPRLSDLPQRLDDLSGRSVRFVRRTKEDRAEIYLQWPPRHDSPRTLRDSMETWVPF
jgi:hypothetical protein